MDALPYVDTLIKEYLLFRGFTHTLTAFQLDLSQDPGCGFSAAALSELVFRQLIPQHRGAELIQLLDFLNMRLCSRLDARFDDVVHDMEVALIKHLLATAAAAGRRDKVSEFLSQYGADLLSSPDADDWRPWFTLAHLQQPQKLPAFQVYFTPEWAQLLQASFYNFLQALLAVVPLPAVLCFNTDRRLRLALQQQVDVLQQRVKNLEQQLVTAAAGKSSQVNAVADVGVQVDLPYTSTHDPAHPHPQLQGPTTTPAITASADATGSSHHAPVAATVAAAAAVAAAAHRREVSLGDWAHLQLSVGRGGAARGRRTGSVDFDAAAAAASGFAGQPYPPEQLDLKPSGSSSSRLGAGAAAAATLTDSPKFERARLPGSLQGTPPQQEVQQQAGEASPSGSTGSMSLSPSVRHPEAGLEANLSTLAAEQQLSGGAGQSALRLAITVASAGSSPSATPDATPTAAAAAAGVEGSEAAVGGQGVQPTGALDASEAAVGGQGVQPTGALDAGGPMGIPISSSSQSLAAGAATASTPGGSAAAGPPPALSSSPVLSWTGSHLGARRFGAPGGFYPGSSPPSGSLPAGAESASSSRRTSSASNSSRRIRSSSVDDGAVGAAASSATGAAGAAGADIGRTPLQQLPIPPTQPAEVVKPLQALTGSLTACAFSPSGDNVATACADGAVGVWCVPGVSGNASRVASITCGASVTCLCWDTRADKVMLLGCSGGAGVRVWHADQKRVLEQVPGDATHPLVTAVATCPSEPCFVVATATATPAAAASPEPTPGAAAAATSSSTSSSSSIQLAVDAGSTGRLIVYNSRSFKRSAVYSLPGDPPLTSLAYNKAGTQLAAGSSTSRVFLLDPGGRVNPLRTWGLPHPRSSCYSSTTGAAGAVQVAWRALPRGHAAAAAAAAAAAGAPVGTAAAGATSPSGSAGASLGLSSGSSSSSSSSPMGGTETLLTCCGGILVEWGVGSATPVQLAAVDVAAAAAAALSGTYLQQSGHKAAEAAVEGGATTAQPTAIASQPPQLAPAQQQQEEPAGVSNSSSQELGHCAFAVSSDGCWCAVVCAGTTRGCVLLYDLLPPPAEGQQTGAASSAAATGNAAATTGLGQQPPVVLLVTEALAGQRVVVDWRPAAAAPGAVLAGGGSSPVLLVGGSKGLAITLRIRV